VLRRPHYILAILAAFGHIWLRQGWEGAFMIDEKQSIERRKHRRAQVPEGVFVSFTPGDSRLGEVLDISMGGLSFRYLATGESPVESGRLNLFISEDDFHLNAVSFETVWDLSSHNVPFTPITMRHSGVKFGDLIEDQISRMEYFIDNHTLELV
jgi:hypothetical protein